MKQVAIMASKNLNKDKAGMSDCAAPDGTGWSGKRISFAEMSATIARRRAETDITDIPRNSGIRRTESKKALLRAIKDVGGEW